MIEADLVSSDGTAVSLRLKGGKLASVPLATLSEADQAFVRTQPVAAAAALSALSVEKRTWPETVQVSPGELEKVVLVTSEGSKFVYRSNAFEFTSQAKLLPSLIKEVARTFEATNRLVAALPWGIECKPPAGMERYLAALYLTRGDYLAAGGPENSGGVYMSKDRTFHIPFESLGIRKLGESYTRDDHYSNDTLVHEITHQMMHDYLDYLPTWAVEGCAEFTEMLPYKSGNFRVSSHEKGLKDYVEQSREIGAVNLPRLQDLFRITHAEWNKLSGSGMPVPGVKSRQRVLYEQSALLVYYFNFLDGDAPRQGHRWLRFMDAVRGEARQWAVYEKEYAEHRKKQEEFFKLPGVKLLPDGRYSYPSKLTPPMAPKPPDGRTQEDDEQVAFKHLGILLEGRSEQAVEQEMAAKYAKTGLKLGF